MEKRGLNAALLYLTTTIPMRRFTIAARDVPGYSSNSTTSFSPSL